MSCNPRASAIWASLSAPGRSCEEQGTAWYSMTQHSQRRGSPVCFDSLHHGLFRNLPYPVSCLAHLLICVDKDDGFLELLLVEDGMELIARDPCKFEKYTSIRYIDQLSIAQGDRYVMFPDMLCYGTESLTTMHRHSSPEYSSPPVPSKCPLPLTQSAPCRCYPPRR